jgi:signal transduction histidine kinase
LLDSPHVDSSIKAFENFRAAPLAGHIIEVRLNNETTKSYVKRLKEPGDPDLMDATSGGSRRQWRYGVAVLSIAAAALVRALLGEWLGDRGMYLIFWPAVMFSSWYGGLGPGLVTTAGSAILIQLLWIRWSDSFVMGLPDAVAQAAFISLAVLIAVLNEQRLRATAMANLHERLAKERHDLLQQELEGRKELEDDLIRANRSLARSNEDLTSFGQMISHDLQEPLRTMILYAELLNRKYANALGCEGREWLDYISSSGKRLSKMIRNLLDYSKAGHREGGNLTTVRLADVVRLAEQNLNDLVRETGAEIRTRELPSLKGDEIQLLQVFQNLISNAMKYRSNLAPKIEIAADQSESHWIVRVRDNGMGIDPSQKELIFKPFVRATSQSDGSGIGLAICRRIVARHGGKIWVDSVPGHGTTFCFSLAKDLKHLV